MDTAWQANGSSQIEELLKFNRFDDAFLKARRVFLWGPVTDVSARQVVSRLLFLESEAPGEEIKFYINSPGGVIYSGNSILDTMSLISSPVATICMGLAASKGSILLSAGTKGRRFIFPSGQVMIHQPLIPGVMQGTASDIEIETEQLIKARRKSAQVLADNCGKDVKDVLKDLNRNYWMDADEAVKYGIVDGVATEFY